MSTTRQAICHAHGHDWLPWGLWHPVMPKGPPVPIVEGMEALPIQKVRYRGCQRCGAGQSEDGEGQIRELRK